ncbi:hypothetical protein M5689_002474 [Euphorbia peplus]|nr:hypothetical protein M5689_002474 [Euphorbia peplus]
MGNCCIRDSSQMFDGEDWGSLKKSSSHGSHCDLTEKRRLLGGDQEDCSSSSSSSGIHCVKIKITKRELEELMERAQKQGLTMEQVMVNFVSSPSDKSDDQLHHFHWKPALQSIPEVN